MINNIKGHMKFTKCGRTEDDGYKVRRQGRPRVLIGELIIRKIKKIG